MTKSEKKDEETLSKNNIKQSDQKDKKSNNLKEETVEEQLKNTKDKLLRIMAEMENQRRRFEKEKLEAFEFGGFNFAKETLSLLDNLQRAHHSIRNDEVLKENKDSINSEYLKIDLNRESFIAKEGVLSEYHLKK